MNRNDRLLLKPMEAAEVLGIGRTRLYELLARRAIPTVRIGHRVRVPVEALRRWIKSEAEGASQDPNVGG